MPRDCLRGLLHEIRRQVQHGNKPTPYLHHRDRRTGKNLKGYGDDSTHWFGGQGKVWMMVKAKLAEWAVLNERRFGTFENS